VLPLRVTREVTAWFAPADPTVFAPGRFPVFILESGYGMHYGFPHDPQAGLKVAKHHHRDETVDPDRVDRTVRPDDEALIRDALAAHLPATNGALASAVTCLYTMTPDGHFILDRLPQAPSVIVASPCSGHGFKFAPVIGEILADLAVDGATQHDISRFRLSRFA
jgi:sarcosine oxidase